MQSLKLQPKISNKLLVILSMGIGPILLAVVLMFVLKVNVPTQEVVHPALVKTSLKKENLVHTHLSPVGDVIIRLEELRDDVSVGFQDEPSTNQEIIAQIDQRLGIYYQIEDYQLRISLHEDDINFDRDAYEAELERLHLELSHLPEL